MGTLLPISLGTRSNPHRNAKHAGNARLINCFAEFLDQEGKNQWAIQSDAGLASFGDALPADGGVRDMLEVGGLLYVVSGGQLISVDGSGNAVVLGAIPTSGPVYMRRNRRSPVQIGIVSTGYYAVYDVGTSVLTQINDPDLPPPSSMAYLDGYGILPNASRYMLTSIDDFTQIDALDEGTVEANPDDIVRAHELEREMVFFGTATTESHQNTGDADFPFTRSQAIDVGCAAADSVAPVDTPNGKALAFVAHDHSVRLIRGYQTLAISTNEVEERIRRLAELGTISSLKSASWSWGGRSFYSLSCADWTRVYDAKTGNWHDKASYQVNRWKVSKVVPFAGKLIAGDANSPQLYTMSESVYAEGSDPLVMKIITPPVHAFPYAGRANALYIDAASGVGLNTDAPQDLDPVLMVRWSKDGGETWSEYRTIALHRLGQTARRLQPITRLGRFGQKGITFELTVSAAVKRIVLSATLDYDQLQAVA